MRNALVVARRELGQLFHSPLAYVFLVVFVFFVQFFSVLALFPQGQGAADMRMFFDHLPWGIVLFAAFVTMRSWAEERQENTYEMLLTFPMRERELVLGKFVAAFAFMSIGIAGTFTLPLILVVIGKPDVGAIVSGYAGAFLLAAMWCAAGVFISGLSRSQLLAVILSAFFGIFSLILGTEVIASFLDGVYPGVGSLLEGAIGGWSHYASFSKGVVEAADAAYFLVWTAAFLWLNHLYIGLRRTPGSTAILAVGTPLALGCAMLTGRLTTGSSWARADLTADRLYTLSPGTIRILSRSKVPVRATFYVSRRADMPKEYESLEREVMDRLREIEVATGGKLIARVAYLSAENAVKPQDETAEDEDPEKALAKAGKEDVSVERRALAKGVQPFVVTSRGTAERSSKAVFATLAIRYREKDEEYLQPIQPERLPELEYLLANTVARLVRSRPPKIALYVGSEPMDPQIKQFYIQQKRPLPDPYAQVEQVLRQEKFDVERVALSAHEPLPDDYDALVAIAPTDLDERQQWELNRALVSGRPTFLAVQRYTWEYRQNARQIGAQRNEANTGVDEILEAQGLGVSRDILMDENNVEIPMATGGMLDNFGGTPLRVPTHMLINKGSMNPESVITQRLPTLLYLWGTPVTTDDTKILKHGLAVTPLFSSGPHSWVVRPDAKNFGFGPPKDGVYTPQPLAVLVKGQFQDAFPGKERPAWPFKMEDMMRNGRPTPAPADPPATALRPAPGQLILTGCAQTWHQRFLGAGGAVSLLLNSLDALTLDEDILLVRSKQPTDRRFDTQSANAVRFWSALPLAIVPIVIIGIGLSVGVLRLRRREAWEAEHAR